MTSRLTSIGGKLVSGSALRVANLAAAALSSLILMPLIVHHIGDRLFGFWTLAATFVGYYSLLDFGLSSAISQYLSLSIGKRDPSESRRVFNAAVRIQSVLGAIALTVTAVLALLAPLFLHDSADAALFRRVVAILGVNVAIGFPPRAYAGVLEAELRFDIQAGLGVLGTILRSALIVLALTHGGGVTALAWMTLFATIPVIALQVYFGRAQVSWARIDRTSLSIERTKNFLSYSVYTFLSVIGDVLRFQVDAFVIATIVGLEAVTHYRVASVFTRYYIDLLIGITGIVQPLLSRLYGAQDRQNLEKVFFFATRVSLCCSLFICCGLVFWGRPFIARWMGASYEDAYWPLVVLSIAVFLDVGQNPSISLLYATFKHRFYTYLNGGEGLLNLALSLMLARSLGVLGVALGTLISAFLTRVVIQPIWVCAAAGFSYREYMKFVATVLLRCGVAMGLAVTLSAWGLKETYSSLIASAITAAGIYGAASWFFVFDRQDRTRLLAVVKRPSGEPSPVSTSNVDSSPLDPTCQEAVII